MEELRKLLIREVEERELIKAGIKRIKNRQIVLNIIGLLILIMFSLNYFQVKKQIQRQEDVVHAARLLIESQEQQIDSLLQPEEFMPKK